MWNFELVLYRMLEGLIRLVESLLQVAPCSQQAVEVNSLGSSRLVVRCKFLVATAMRLLEEMFLSLLVLPWAASIRTAVEVPFLFMPATLRLVMDKVVLSM